MENENIENQESQESQNELLLKEQSDLQIPEENTPETVPDPKPESKKIKVLLTILSSFIILILIGIGLYSLYFNYQKRKYADFNLVNFINPEELVFQTIEFNKFIVYGTDKNRILANTFLGKYTDEVQIYFVKGAVDISLGNELKNAQINWGKTDFIKKNLCLEFDLSNTSTLFQTNVRIAAKDIYLVANNESKELFSLDFVKNKDSEELLMKIKNDLQAEFSKQINNKNIKNTQEFEAFEDSLEKLICSKSSDQWKSISVHYKF